MHDREQLRHFAKEMRSDPTLGERILWDELRARRLGVKVRRQHPVGPFIPDFVCFSHRLVIEVDGDSHEDPERDARRDQWFRDNGWRVLRFTDDEVIGELDMVLDTIWYTLNANEEK